AAPSGRHRGLARGRTAWRPRLWHRRTGSARNRVPVPAELPQQPPLPAAAGCLQGGLRHRRAGHARCGAGARRSHRHRRSLPVLRARHPPVEGPRRTGEGTRDPPQRGHRPGRCDRSHGAHRPLVRRRARRPHRRRHGAQVARQRRRGLPHRCALHPAPGRGDRRRRVRVRAPPGRLGEDRATRRGADRRRRGDRRQYLHRPGRAGRHRDRGRGQAGQPDPDRPQRPHRQAHRHGRLRRGGGQCHHRRPLHHRRPGRHPRPPDHRRPRAHFRDFVGHALHPQARHLYRGLPPRRECGLGEERGIAQAAARPARTRQGPRKESM
ncbi:MAG: UDP-3-O-[3-hydroxymyristoyl] glucosamine N-acyltransferase, partial [uncultured Ramlibacter sp.]